MLRRYAIRKFAIITASVALIFGSLQITSVQKELIRACIGNSVNFDFKNSEGVFPFNFRINELDINTSDLDLDINNLGISLSAKMFHVKHLKIDKVKIKLPKETKLCPADFQIALPLIMQKFIDYAEIGKLDIDGEIFKEIKLSHDSETGYRKFEGNSRFGKLETSWKFEDSKIKGKANFNDIMLQAEYDRNNNHLIANYADLTLDGIWTEDIFKGTIALGEFKPNVEISAKDEFFKIAFIDRESGLSGKIDYDLDKFIAFVHDVAISDMLKVTPFSIDSSLKVSDFSVLFKKGKVEFKGVDISSDKFSFGNCKISGIDLSQFKSLNIKGFLEGSGEYKQNHEDLKLKFKNLQYEDFQFPDLEVTAQHSKTESNISAVFSALEKKQKLDCKIKTQDWLITKDSKIDFKTDGSMNLADYKIGRGQRVRGKMIYKIQASGTLLKPEFNGTINLKDGIYVNITSGTYVRDITLNCDINKDSLNIKKIYARDDSKKGGTIEGFGKIQYIDMKLKTDIKLKAENFKAVDQEWLSGGRIFGTLKLNGDLLDKVNVKGDFYSNKPTIDISGIVMLSMRSTDLIIKKQKQSKDQKNQKVKFPPNIKLEIKPELKVIGFGLESIWSGEAKITGDLMDPDYVATAKLKNGKIKLTDNDFKLKDGDVIINKDDIDIKLAAEKKVDKIKVGAKFTQKAGESKVRLYSNPYMSDKDIMSYMLFDKNASEISMGEGMTLFTAMNKLSGKADFDILGRMKTIFGVDTISIKKNKTSSGTEYDSVSLGKKLGKFRVSVDQATGKDATNVVVEADVAKHTKVSVDLSSRDSVGGGVLWSRRY